MSAPTPEAAGEPAERRRRRADLAGEDGQEHGVGVAHEADQREEQQDGADGAKGADIVPAFAHLFEHAGVAAAEFEWPDAHQQQRSDHREVADAVDEEAPAFADGRDDEAGDGGADEPRAVGHRGVDGDGVAEVVAVVDHLDEEGLAAGHVERVDQALQGGEGDDLP